MTADAMSAVRSAHQKLSTSIALSVIAGRSEQHERVEDEDDEEAEDERQRQPDRRDERQDQRVQDGDDEGDDDRAQEGLDLDVRHDPGRDEERGGRDEPGHEELERLDLRPDHPLLRDHLRILTRRVRPRAPLRALLEQLELGSELCCGRLLPVEQRVGLRDVPWQLGGIPPSWR